MAGNSYFYHDLGGGYLTNPTTGEILNSNTGQVYPSADALRSEAASYQPSSQSQGATGQGGGAQGGLASGLSSGVGAYGLYNATTGGAAATTVAPAATSAGSYQLAGTLGSQGAADLSASGASTAGSSLLSTAPGTAGASFLPAAGVAAGAVTGLYQGKGIANAIEKKDMSLAEETALALPTFGYSYAVDPVRKMFISKQKQEQKNRKDGRGGLQKLGFMGDDSRSTYTNDLGLNFNIADYKKNTGKNAYNIDFNEGDADQAVKVGAVNSLAAAIAGGDKKLQSDLAGELYNANSSGGDFWANLQSSANKAGGVDAWSKAISEKKGIKDEDRAAFLSGLDSIYNVNSRNTIMASQGKPTATNKPVNAKPFPFSPPIKPVVQNQSINPRLKGKR